LIHFLLSWNWLSVKSKLQQYQYFSIKLIELPLVEAMATVEPGVVSSVRYSIPFKAGSIEFPFNLGGVPWSNFKVVA
jgi:hypothetical protein